MIEPVGNDVIRVEDEYYIRATSSLADDRTHVLKHGESFAVLDRHGDARGLGRGEQGVYHEGVRHVSRSVLELGGERPILVGSTVTADNVTLVVNLTNPDIDADGMPGVPMGTLHVIRTVFLREGVCYDRFEVRNHGSTVAPLDLSLSVEADFVDVFEVRGASRAKRGRMLPPDVSGAALTLGYVGLDGVKRTTRVSGDPGAEVTAESVAFTAELAPGAHTSFTVAMTFSDEDAAPFEPALDARRRERPELEDGRCAIVTSNEQFNDWLRRSAADLAMMVTQTPWGSYPYAGVPWFSCAFGRDALITAFEALWVDPLLARGVLGFLAHHQATEVDPSRVAEPGKILHELRHGEMAALGEVPFGRYYGSVDATPLFVVLAGAYHEATGDLELIEEIWPNVEAALAWMDGPGDVDGDGFVEYRGDDHHGLVQQGWKDSHDSVFHADGTPATGPIALCEVQGYVYWAKQHAARLARALGDSDRSLELEAQARLLRASFDRAFWSEELGTYALALDGDKRPCTVRSSNAGHALLAGIASDVAASRVAETLLSEAQFSGWGVRTLASGESRYRPISYHNGSVWPHDNALIAAGLARYRFKHEALRIMDAMFDMSRHLELARLPELVCGFARREGEGPTSYPLACAPQSWAAAAPYLLLSSCLGMSVDAAARQVRFDFPVLPDYLDQVHITGLRVADATIDLALYRYPQDVGINVTGRTGEVDVVIVK